MNFYIISSIFFLLESLIEAAPSCKSLPCIHIDIYYESLCTKCHHFFESQLAPSYPAFKDHLHINFIPYGNADHIKDKKKQWLFNCEHGKLECEGNKAQACALEIIKKKSNSKQKQEHSVHLVNCVMLSISPATSVSRCAKTIGLSSSAQSDIAKCAKSSSGNDLLAGHGDKTHLLWPRLKFVPTIIINEVYSEKHQNEAYHNFKGFVCNYLSHRGRKLSHCL